MADVIKARVQPIQATAAAFTAANPVLLSGEFGYETDTQRLKSGDGVTAWADLSYKEVIDGVISVNGRNGTVTLTKTDVGLSNVDNTSDLNKPVSDPQATALTTKQDNLVSGVTIRTVNNIPVLGSGNITIDPGGNVDSVNGATGVVVLNTSDINDTLDKRYVTDSQRTNIGTALQPGANISTLTNNSGFITGTGTYANLRAQATTAADVGLGAVDNTSDADKPVSTAQDTAIGLKENTANKVTSLATPNNTTFPTTAAVSTAIADIAAGETFQGDWNATTNTPTLVSSVGTEGHYYQVAVSGTTTLDGISTWDVGDEVIFRNGVWIKRAGLSVTSVAGKTGAVTLVTGDLTNFDAGVAATPSVTANTAKRTYPLVDENKLATIESGAQVNVGDVFSNVGTYAGLRAQATTQADVGLGSVTNDAQLKIASNLSDLNNAATARTNIGLGNVNNTADADKPVSTATQTALNGKADIDGSYALLRAQATTKDDVGLGNVDNTSDLNKPISTATQTALDLKINTSAVINNLTSTSTTAPLSAAQGKALQDNKVATADFNPNPYTGFPDPATITDGQVILVRP